MLSSRPIATRLATGALGTLLGDVVAQLLQRTAAPCTSGKKARKQHWWQLDGARSARLVGFSALVGTPVACMWYGLLDQVRLAFVLCFSTSARPRTESSACIQGKGCEGLSCRRPQTGMWHNAQQPQSIKQSMWAALRHAVTPTCYCLGSSFADTYSNTHLPLSCLFIC